MSTKTKSNYPVTKCVRFNCPNRGREGDEGCRGCVAFSNYVTMEEPIVWHTFSIHEAQEHLKNVVYKIMGSNTVTRKPIN